MQRWETDPVVAIVRMLPFAISSGLARKIATAVLSCYDQKHQTRGHPIPRRLWEENPDFREHLRTGLRHQLHTELAEHGVLLTELPHERLEYTAGFSFQPVPADHPDWDHVVVVLEAKTRQPHIQPTEKGETDADHVWR